MKHVYSKIKYDISIYINMNKEKPGAYVIINEITMGYERFINYCQIPLVWPFDQKNEVKPQRGGERSVVNFT